MKNRPRSVFIFDQTIADINVIDSKGDMKRPVMFSVIDALSGAIVSFKIQMPGTDRRDEGQP